MYSDSKIYDDTVAIVKSAVGSSTESTWLVGNNASVHVANYIKAVFKALKEINEQCKD